MSLLKNIQLAWDFAGYYVKSTNRHGLQGPFAYALNEAVFRRDRFDESFLPIERLRKKMLADTRTIQVRDFGAGFGGVNYTARTVSYIAKHSAKPPRYARMLYRLVKHLQPATMLELGTSFGISALYQSCGAPKSKMITLEGCPNTAQQARENFSLFPHFQIEVVEGPFDETLPSVLAQQLTIDFVYLDGHHRLEPTLKYVEMIYPHLSPDAIIVVDDINWSEEMKQAWQQLKTDARFTQSIDVFMMGLLFTNKDLSKENFIIRY